MLRMTRASGIAAAMPIAMPDATSFRPCVTIIHTMSPDCAPGATRMPISCVLCVT